MHAKLTLATVAAGDDGFSESGAFVAGGESGTDNPEAAVVDIMRRMEEGRGDGKK
jgi:hypothetical protein